MLDEVGREDVARRAQVVRELDERRLFVERHDPGERPGEVTARRLRVPEVELGRREAEPAARVRSSVGRVEEPERLDERLARARRVLHEVARAEGDHEPRREAGVRGAGERLDEAVGQLAAALGLAAEEVVDGAERVVAHGGSQLGQDVTKRFAVAHEAVLHLAPVAREAGQNVSTGRSVALRNGSCREFDGSNAVRRCHAWHVRCPTGAHPMDDLTRVAPQAGSEVKGRLVFKSGPRCAETFDLRGAGRFVVGRSPDVDVPVDHPSVSRRHCELFVEGDQVQVKDLGSTHGTHVDGERVERVRLAHGSTLRLGSIEILVELDDDASSAFATRPLPANAPPRNRALVPGYEMGACLGEGSMGAVFEARDAEGRPVAIKLLKLTLERHDEDRARFLREAVTARSLVHPNVVRVLEHGDASGVLYMVMELVNGRTLRQRIESEGPLPIDLAVGATRQVARALEHARTAGIVHRDVKPGNVMVGEDGTAKLLDFGLAKSLDEKGNLTATNQVLGTLAYSSPEQLLGSARVDHRSDVYSLGATLYHALAGAPPFRARTNAEYGLMILREVPRPIEELRPEIPPRVAELVARCLAKAPEDRPQTAGEVERVLA